MARKSTKTAKTVVRLFWRLADGTHIYQYGPTGEAVAAILSGSIYPDNTIHTQPMYRAWSNTGGERALEVVALWPSLPTPYTWSTLDKVVSLLVRNHGFMFNSERVNGAEVEEVEFETRDGQRVTVKMVTEAEASAEWLMLQHLAGNY